MKNIKVLVGLLAITALCTMPAKSEAQTRVVGATGGLAVVQGNTVDFGGTYPLFGTVSPSDSLQVSDSIAYLISVVHLNDVGAYLTWYWNKIGSGNPTVTLSFLQSNDNVNWFTVPKGTAETAYSKTFSPTANTWFNVDFRADTALISAKYLKVYFITSATASTKGKIFNRLKTFIK